MNDDRRTFMKASVGAATIPLFGKKSESKPKRKIEGVPLAVVTNQIIPGISYVHRDEIDSVIVDETGRYIGWIDRDGADHRCQELKIVCSH